MEQLVLRLTSDQDEKVAFVRSGEVEGLGRVLSFLKGITTLYDTKGDNE